MYVWIEEGGIYRLYLCEVELWIVTQQKKFRSTNKMVLINGPSLLVTAATLLGILNSAEGIDCFDCYSLDGSRRDCEDEFGPHNKTGHLIHRKCRVGYLNFEAHFCVKIKGIKEKTGQHIIVRTCAVDDWGTQCGDLLFEQEGKMDPITGCLATCNFDGCNTATRLGPSPLCMLHVLSAFLTILFLTGGYLSGLSSILNTR